MENQQTHLRVDNVTEMTTFDYSNENLPRDFDIRIEVAEQREILEQSQLKARVNLLCQNKGERLFPFTPPERPAQKNIQLSISSSVNHNPCR